MKVKYYILLFCISFFIIGCGKTDGETSINKSTNQMEGISSGDSQEQVINDNYNSENQNTDKVKEKKEAAEEISEQDLLNAIYDRYYSQWSEESMLTAIEEKSQYLKSCSFYKEVLEYMENVREVKDIANVVEPLYLTDMKYYKSQDFENVPLLIIHLAKNEIYARHGYIFKNEDLNNYFLGQLWYEPSSIPEDFDDSVFNEYEKANLKLLADMDKYE